MMNTYPCQFIRCHLAAVRPIPNERIKDILEIAIRVQAKLEGDHEVGVPFHKILACIADTSRVMLDRSGLIDTVRAIPSSYSNSIRTLDRNAAERNVAALVDWYTYGTLKDSLSGGDPWSQQLLDDIARNDTSTHPAWNALLLHCAGLKSSKPGPKWTVITSKLVEDVGMPDLLKKLEACIPRCAEPWNCALYSEDANVLKGLVFAAALQPDRRLTSMLRDLIVIALGTVPNVGTRSQKLGNAAIYALAKIQDVEAIGQLLRARQGINNRPGRTLIAKIIDEFAARQGISTEELESLAWAAVSS